MTTGALRNLPRTKQLTAAMALVLTASTAAVRAQQSDDPLAIYQWHLKNTGQQVIADTRPVPGNDLNVDGLYRNNIRGQGVTIAIIDSGLQIAHPDLAANVAAVPGRNFNANARNRNDPTALNPTINSHGTMVGGISAAVGNNGLGVRGVAPAATLKGFNWLEQNASRKNLYADQQNLRYAWWDGPEVADVQVFNNSWGAGSGNGNLPVSQSRNATASFESAMSGTRSGRGGIYVKAAGNGFEYAALQQDLGVTIDSCDSQTKKLNVGCLPAGYDPRNNFFNVITVAAVRADGKRSSYSSVGSAVWVSGFGGQYGLQRQYDPSKRSLAYDPAIVTTDITGCEEGSNRNEARQNALDGDQSTIDRTCNYTAKMNGTSAATPMVSGVAALVLEANPQLSFRDVKYILAVTAKKTDSQQAATRLDDGRELVPGWTTNAAGHAYSNWYGFGVVDAARAVQAASTFQSLGPLVDSGWRTVTQGVAIGSTPQTTRLVVQVPAGARKVESVQLGFGVDHANTRHLQFVLVSPSGTRSVVQPAFTAIGSRFFGGQSSFRSWDLLSSNAFLDENGAGSWTLEVTDMGQPKSVASRGKLESFTIRVLGH